MKTSSCDGERWSWSVGVGNRRRLPRSWDGLGNGFGSGFIVTRLMVRQVWLIGPTAPRRVSGACRMRRLRRSFRSGNCSTPTGLPTPGRGRSRPTCQPSPEPYRPFTNRRRSREPPPVRSTSNPRKAMSTAQLHRSARDRCRLCRLPGRQKVVDLWGGDRNSVTKAAWDENTIVPLDLEGGGAGCPGTGGAARHRQGYHGIITTTPVRSPPYRSLGATPRSEQL